MGLRKWRWTAEKNNVARRTGHTYNTHRSKHPTPIGAGMKRAKAREDAFRAAQEARLADALEPMPSRQVKRRIAMGRAR